MLRQKYALRTLLEPLWEKPMIRKTGVVYYFTLALMAVVATGAFAAERVPAGFIAFAPEPMSWKDAKAFCESKGGRLPLVNNSATYDGRSDVSSIDGFGSVGSPWPKELPGGRADGYWMGTTHERRDGELWFVVNDSGNVILITDEVPSLRVLCVSPNPKK
jgi:hypothetical protein